MLHMADWCGVLVATSEIIYTEMLQSYYKEQRLFLFSYWKTTLHVVATPIFHNNFVLNQFHNYDGLTHPIVHKLTA